MLPGITGLWQVEAHDNPSFEAYRRLDLFYVENWSITLDLLIMLGTVEHLIVRVFTSMRHTPKPKKAKLPTETTTEPSPEPPATERSHVGKLLDQDDGGEVERAVDVGERLGGVAELLVHHGAVQQ